MFYPDGNRNEKEKGTRDNVTVERFKYSLLMTRLATTRPKTDSVIVQLKISGVHLG